MVGNDVVDLRDPDATPVLAPRFDARVFSEAERAALAVAPDRVRLRWQLWAAKEAAYKLAVKRDPRTVFSPSRFEVTLLPRGDGALRGRVESPVGPLEVEIEEHAGALHGVARDGSARVIAAMTRLGAPELDANDPDSPGRAARRFAREEIARVLHAPDSALEVRKRGRVPELWVDGRRAADLSLSHHGDVVGFACALEALGAPGGAGAGGAS